MVNFYLKSYKPYTESAWYDLILIYVDPLKKYQLVLKYNCSIFCQNNLQSNIISTNQSTYFCLLNNTGGFCLLTYQNDLWSMFIYLMIRITWTYLLTWTTLSRCFIRNLSICWGLISLNLEYESYISLVISTEHYRKIDYKFISHKVKYFFYIDIYCLYVINIIYAIN